ncbi:hypothetical protein OESDEN_08377 [Oesophagostomum dentatum]|uniref:Uncharacterized protein n=1 Tax=Oesophagostomum dentatum TaxID=61180 RepID=A0A0B1T8P9_OESDE|nr:hypothetical protein OESDEN_08377 [Oesophagostomum dentatum]
METHLHRCTFFLLFVAVLMHIVYGWEQQNCNTYCGRPCRQIDSDHLYHGCLLMYRQHYNCPVTGCGWADGPPVEGPPPDGGP